jgi:hypothetical protein
VTGRRRPVNATFHAPDTKTGAKAADVELAKLLVKVDGERATPRSGITVGQLLERRVEHRRPGWEAGSPGQPDERRRALPARSGSGGGSEPRVPTRRARRGRHLTSSDQRAK